MEQILMEYEKKDSINQTFQSVLDIIIEESKEYKKLSNENQELYQENKNKKMIEEKQEETNKQLA